MSLDGLRAWIGEVERKLGARTRVFLALTVIAIGIGGAAIYLAIDARESSVSEGDVQALQERLEARLGAGGGETEVAQLEAKLNALEAEVAALKGEGDKSRKGKGTSEGTSGAGAAGEDTGGESPSETGATGGATGGAPSAAKLEELLQQGKGQPAEGE
jgi:hypothetical protein